MHPNTYLGMTRQDRERAMIQRALERAARPVASSDPASSAAGSAASRGWPARPAAPSPASTSGLRRYLPSDRLLQPLTLAAYPKRPRSLLGKRGGRFIRRTQGRMMPGMARRLSSPVFIGRSSELKTLLATADSSRPGSTAVTLVGGEAGVGKSRLVAELADGLRDPAGSSSQGGSVAVGDEDCRSARSSRPCAPCRARSSPERIAAAAGASLPELARLVPELASAARPRPDPDGPGRLAPGPDLRGHPAAPRPARRHEPGPAHRRGRALGRPLDPRPAGLPRPQRARRAPVHRRDLPQRRAAPPSSADRLAGRGRTPAAGRADRPGPVRARRARRDDRHDRGRSARAVPGRLDRAAIRRQRVLRRGARRRHRRARARATTACPRRCAASSWSGWPARRRTPVTWSRSPPSPAARSSTTCSPRCAACPRPT